jgi:Na+/melibiose symporter-like transporter
MLTLFTTRERASAITGDLIEEGRASSLNVMRVCLALFLRAVAARPVRMALLVGFGLILQVALRGLAVPLIIRVGWGPEEYSRTILYVTLVAGMVTPLLVGWATAKLGRGDEFTACLALAIAAKVLVLLNALSGGHAWNPGYWQRALHFREDFLPIPFILAAALIMRLRRLSPGAE